MERIELIELIADMLTKIDVERSRFDRGTDQRISLDGLRDRLDGDLKQLIRSTFRDDTIKFAKATSAITEANVELRKTIGSLDKIAETLKNVVVFVKAVDGLVKAVAPLF